MTLDNFITEKFITENFNIKSSHTNSYYFYSIKPKTELGEMAICMESYNFLTWRYRFLSFIKTKDSKFVRHDIDRISKFLSKFYNIIQILDDDKIFKLLRRHADN
jgi:hypothetical protein